METIKTVEELVRLNPKTIRRDEKLMRFYIEVYKDAFSIEPNCAGCTFNRDFKKLKNFVAKGGRSNVKPKNVEIMSSKRKYTIKPQFKNTILTYRVGNRPFRAYGRSASDEFIEKFLSEGTKEQITERKKMFANLGLKKKSAKSEAKEPEAKPQGEPQAGGEKKSDGEKYNEVVELKAQLKTMKRPEMDKLAKTLELNPEEYANKEVLSKAILEKVADSNKVEDKQD